MQKIRKLQRSIKAISPIISVLLLCAIAIVASVVIYAWVMGYLGAGTTKAGNAISIQSISSNQPAAGDLTIYVQNTGLGSVQLNPDSAVYINNTVETIFSVNNNPTNGLITIAPHQTVALGVAYSGTGPVTIKVVTTKGISWQTTAIITTNGIAYQVTFGTSGGADSTISPSGTQTYPAGLQVGISVTSVAAGYTFSGWTTTGQITIADASSASTTATINGAGTVTATFTQSNYEVTFSTSNGGSDSTTSPSGPQTYPAGSTVPISATAGTGYEFSDWSATGSITIADANSASTTATINGAGTVTANFAPTLTGIGITPVTSSISAGGSQSFTATALGPGGVSLGVVTSSAAWSITSGAGGSWSGGTYTSGNVGAWTVTATYGGFTSNTAQLTVSGPLYEFSISTIGLEQTAGTPFTLTITAVDANGYTVANFAGSATLTDLTGSISPTSTGAFTDGVWTGSVTIKTAVTTDLITATDSSNSGVTGVSNTFSVNTGALATVSVSGPTSVTAGGTATFTATGYDAEGNSLGVETASWSITSGAAGSWSGNVYTSQKAGSWTVSALVSGVTGTAPLTVNPGALASFTFGTISSPQTAGKDFTITVTAVDAYGNTVTTYTGLVLFSDLSSSISPGESGTFTNGVYTGIVEITTAYTNDVITATDVSTGLTGSSNAFNVAASSAYQLAYIAGAGQTLPIDTQSSVITVQLQDQYGNPVNALTAVTVTLTPSDSATCTFYSNPTTIITTIPATITIPAGQNSASFYFNDTTAEIESIVASASGLLPATTTITYTTYKLVFVPNTGSVAQGQDSTALKVEEETSTGVITTYHPHGQAITVTLTTSSSTGEFLNTAKTVITTTSISVGYYYSQNTFYYLDTSVGSVTLTATATGFTAGTASFTIYQPVLTSFAFNTISSPQTTGQAFSITVTALDQYGNVYTGYTGTNTLTLTGATGTISPSPTTAFSAGVWTGSVTISGTITTPTSVSISTSDTSATSITGTSSTFTLYTPELTSFTITSSGYGGYGGGNIGNQETGVNFGITITALDQEGATLTTFDGSVALTETGGGAGGAVSPASVTLTNGVYTGNVYVTKAGTGVTLTATYDGVSSASNTFTVTAELYKFVFNTISSPQTAGTSFSITITAEDMAGDTVTTYQSSTALTETGVTGGAVSPASVTFTNGVYTGSVYVTIVGSAVSITATYDGVSSASNTFTVTAGALYKFGFSTISSPQTAGTSFSITITAEDQYGNTVTSYTGTNSLTVSAGTISPTTTGAFTSGVWTGSVTLTKSGSNIYISTSDTSATSITGTSNTFTVNAGAATKLVVSSSTSVTAGTAFTVTVTAEDADGNTATGYTGTIHFTSSDGKAVLPPNYTFTAANAGVHTFSVTLETAGTQSITATDTVTSSITGSQTGITVSPGSLYQYVFGTIPTPQTSGKGFTVTVTQEDQYGNVITSNQGTPTISHAVIVSGTGTITSVTSSGWTFNTSTGVWTGTVTVTVTGTPTVYIYVSGYQGYQNSNNFSV